MHPLLPNIRPGSRLTGSSEKVAHVMVAKVAREAANELFETLMGQNEIRDHWRNGHPGKSEKELRRLFVVKYWGDCIPFARATLARMLDGPLDEGLKEQIADALIKDRALRPAESSKAPAAEIINREMLKGNLR